MQYYASMPNDQQALAESRALATLLVMTAERMKADFNAAIEPFGLPGSLARALINLDSPLPMRTLAEHLSCDQSYVTGLADALEERGLITREPGADRRVKVLTPTKAGAALRKKLTRAVNGDSLALTRLNARDRRELTRLLTTLLDTDD